MKTTTLQFKHSIKRPPYRVALLFIPLALACFALAPEARATCLDACLTNNNTVQGDDALINNTGSENTATGLDALLSNTEGFYNTATGSEALASNTTGGGNTATGKTALFSNTTGSNNTANGTSGLTGT